MPEREVVVDKERIEYEGPFDISDFYKLFETFAIDKGYTRAEVKHTESVTKDGKFVEVIYAPWKWTTDYVNLIIRIRIQMQNIKDIIVDGKKLQKGKVTVVFDGIVETDYENRWEGRPILLVLRTFYDKYIYRSLTGGFEGIVRSDVMHWKELVKSFLNLYALK